MAELAWLDFETEAIESRPRYPPHPVGFALTLPGKAPRYYAWGHPEGNNCDKQYAETVLRELWRSEYDIGMFNAKFDLDVAQTHFNLPKLDWRRVHDPMILLFLDNPYAASYRLKESAKLWLGMEPEESDAVRDWLVDQGYVGRSTKDFGGYICKAPGWLVGAYAIGDVDRTAKLHALLHPRVMEAGMGRAYAREMELLPILLENERHGIRVDFHRLAQNIGSGRRALELCDGWLRKTLNKPDLNVNSDVQVANALDEYGAVMEWSYTPTGQKSMAKDRLKLEHFAKQEIFHVLNYRNRMTTALGTFMEPWREMAQEHHRIYTNWNQVRTFGQGKEFAGARTGRLSSNPNFQNIPKRFKAPIPEGLDVPALPYLRSYLLPDEHEVWVHRDYNQQELRILAHFEDELLAKTFSEAPRTDMHNFIHDRIKDISGIDLTRDQTKTLNFGLLYGMGLDKLANDLGCAYHEAASIKGAQRRAIPGLESLERDVKWYGRQGKPITTWGGRKYFVEPSPDGRDYSYKLLNYLIQGSAADCTKQAVINYHSIKKYGTLLNTVHDEINISVPERVAAFESNLLREAMESVKFDVPMLSDGKIVNNWGEAK